MSWRRFFAKICQESQYLKHSRAILKARDRNERFTRTSRRIFRERGRVWPWQRAITATGARSHKSEQCGRAPMPAELSRRYARAKSALPSIPRIPPTVSRHGRRGEPDAFAAQRACRRNDQASLARRAGRAIDHHSLSAEGGADPAAHPAAAAGNAARSVRSIGVHPERQVLRAMALVAYSKHRRCEQLSFGGARPREPKPVAVAR